MIKENSFLKNIFRPMYYGFEKFLYNRSGFEKKIRFFKDIHKGQPMLIVGNGPSLNNSAIDNIPDMPSIGMNKINLLFDKVKWRPDYIVSTNKYVVKQNKSFFQSTNIPLFLAWQSRYYLEKSNKFNYFFNSYKTGFSQNASQILYSGATVTNNCLQLAYYMGANPVFLVGVDHNFVFNGKPHELQVSKENDVNHFDKNYFGQNTAWQLPDLKTSEKAFRIADQTFKQDGRIVYDATVNGKLNVFKKIDLIKIASYL